MKEEPKPGDILRGFLSQFLSEEDVRRTMDRIAKAENEDIINYPAHYTSHPSGIECIQITEHMDFLLGNALKYIWRAGMKDDAVQDLKKARFYIDRKISQLTN